MKFNNIDNKKYDGHPHPFGGYDVLAQASNLLRTMFVNHILNNKAICAEIKYNKKYYGHPRPLDGRNVLAQDSNLTKGRKHN